MFSKIFEDPTWENSKFIPDERRGFENFFMIYENHTGR